MNVGDAIDGYVKIRDQKKELDAVQKEQMAPLNEKLRTIEAWLMREFLKSNVTQQKGTSGGTAFIQSNDSVKVTDQEVFMQFCKDRDAYELLDVRASKTVVKAFIENSNEVPPGISYTQANVIRVRR